MSLSLPHYVNVHGHQSRPPPYTRTTIVFVLPSTPGDTSSDSKSCFDPTPSYCPIRQQAQRVSSHSSLPTSIAQSPTLPCPTPLDAALTFRIARSARPGCGNSSIRSPSTTAKLVRITSLLNSGRLTSVAKAALPVSPIANSLVLGPYKRV